MARDALSLPPVPPPARDDRPWRDRLLVIAFVVALAVPGLLVIKNADRERTVFENRPTAAWPDRHVGVAFATQFEQAFADRFGGRDRLIRVHHGVLAELFHRSAVPTVMLGREGWLFFLGEDAHALDRHFRGLQPFPEYEIDALVRELQRRHAYLAARGIAYVVLVVPDKFTIYPEYLPAWVHPATPTPLARALRKIAADGSIPFIDLRALLSAAKQRERVYFKTDSHWNLAGASVAYESLMQEIRKQLTSARLPVVAPAARPPYVPGVDRYSGDLANMLGLPERYAEDDLVPLGKLLANPTSRCAQRTDHGEFPGFEFYGCARPGLPRAVMYRDSMGIPLIPLLAENFSHIIFVSSRKLEPALIARERPDVVIEELVERSLNAPATLPLQASP
jgi:alginate O-acetyltransferase complex protein AlgJ